ncbi:unnamed protein product [Cladocopium goreaui]|uniref:Shaggy-related protein kinase theta (ASK-theta ) (Shaggy-related protein kinase 32) (AtSK32) n=1 Tax=Cladocopium goreaui TaxID=2562237 RepID=A0A9P1DBZ0_9DINO|nr:unnamed protein product [Cladocopium goreaui]
MSSKGDASSDLRALQNSFQSMKMDSGKSEDGSKKTSFTYNAERVLGSGSFGVVYQAQVVETGESVAIKKVFQDKRYKNRELQIMKELRHPNVVELKHAFYTSGEKPGETYLNVVMEYCSDTIYRVMKHYSKMKQPVPHIFVQLYSYQVKREREREIEGERESGFLETHRWAVLVPTSTLWGQDLSSRHQASKPPGGRAYARFEAMDLGFL